MYRRETYEEVGCPKDTVKYIVNSLQSLQFKHQACLPGSSEGTYNIRIQRSPRPHAYRTLRARAGLPPKSLKIHERRSPKLEHVYCCTVTFKPFSSFLDQGLTPVFDPKKTCVGSESVKVETGSTSVKPEATVNASSTNEPNHGPGFPASRSSPVKAESGSDEIDTDMIITNIIEDIVDVVSCHSGSYQRTNNEETNFNVQPTQVSLKPMPVTEYRPCYEIAELHVAPWHQGQGLEDVILGYLLDVASLHDAQFPALSRDEEIESEREEEQEPIIVVKAMDDFDKEFYASKGFVQSDTAKDNQFSHMILKEGVIKALAKKRREEERNNEALAEKSRVKEWDDDDIWTTRRKEYEEILKAEGVLEKPRPERSPKRGEDQPEEMLENPSDIIQSIEKPEILKNDLDVIRAIDQPEEVMSRGMVSFSEDIPGQDGRKRMAEVMCWDMVSLSEDIPRQDGQKRVAFPIRLRSGSRPSEDIPGQDGQKRMALPVRMRSEPRIETCERQNAARVRKEALSRRSRASSH